MAKKPRRRRTAAAITTARSPRSPTDLAKIVGKIVKLIESLEPAHREKVMESALKLVVARRPDTTDAPPPRPRISLPDLIGTTPTFHASDLAPGGAPLK